MSLRSLIAKWGRKLLGEERYLTLRGQTETIKRIHREVRNFFPNRKRSRVFWAEMSVQKDFVEKAGIDQNVMTIVDVGANKGDMTKAYRRLFPAAKIVCFEPHPIVFAELEQRFASYPNIIPVMKAISDQPGVVPFHIYNHSTMSSMARVAMNPSRSLRLVRTIEVSVTTLDSFCEEQGISRIDILKVDTQGFDLHVFRGAQRLLSSSSIHFILFEATIFPVYEREAYFHEIHSYLAQFDYRLCRIFNTKYVRDNGQLSWFDAFFISPHVQEAILPEFAQQGYASAIKEGEDSSAGISS